MADTRRTNQSQPYPNQYQGQGGYDDQTVRQGQYVYGQNGQGQPYQGQPRGQGGYNDRTVRQGQYVYGQNGQRQPYQGQPYQGQPPQQGRPYQRSGATYQDGQYGRTINDAAYRDTRYSNPGGPVPPSGRKGSPVVTVLLSVLLVAAIGVFGFSGYKLYNIFLSDGSNSYKVGEKEYGGLENSYFDESTASSKTGDDGTVNEADSLKQPYIATTAELEVPENIEGIIEGTQTEEVQENGTYKELPKLHNPVDFEGLEAINEEIIGWIKISALDLSYPVAQAKDNDYYLHRTFRKEDNFAGCIFLNCSNTRYLTDQNSIIYGHNMKNGSMFGTLSKYQQQSTFDAGQYFWIFTKEFIYQYHIFSTHVVSSVGDDYRTRFTTKEFDDYIAKCRADSYIKTNVDVPQGSRIMTLSTCTGDDSTRFIVQGVLTQVYVSA